MVKFQRHRRLFRRRKGLVILLTSTALLLIVIRRFIIQGGSVLQTTTTTTTAGVELLGNLNRPQPKPQPQPQHTSRYSHNHPIDNLIREAQENFDQLVARESRSLEDAAAAYRERRGRHPPPAFKLWYEFAAERDAIIVEDFFDQIYHDLEPFWAVDSAKIRNDSHEYEMKISVRNGRATAKTGWFWTRIWLDMIRTIEHILPDMDIALNAMDEPRIVVPWEEMEVLHEQAKKTRRMVKPKQAVTAFQNLGPHAHASRHGGANASPRQFDTTTPYWNLLRRGCAPDSLARRADPLTDFSSTPSISTDNATPHARHGFVSNYTLSADICHQPDLQGLEGILIEPLSTSTTADLFPLFGGSKLGVNNEILLPAAMYWEGDVRFTGSSHDHGDGDGDGDGDGGRRWRWRWGEKLDGVIWRGVATGGRNRESNWKGFHRHRFVAMNNASAVRAAEREGTRPVNFQLPKHQRQHQHPDGSPLPLEVSSVSSVSVSAQKTGQLGDWIESWSNVGFVDLFCTPAMENGQCNYTDKYFETVGAVAMEDQFQYKYLVDVDGNSFSGRYLGFLRSTSLPIKATLFREWHDSRLVAWKHFVPMDNRFAEYYAIMEYFLGGIGGGDGGSGATAADVPGHDEEAEMIALEGREWASRVLRPEDMQIYTFRLLLEYARVSNEHREEMGWVEDLL